MSNLRVLRAASTDQLQQTGLRTRHSHYVLIEGMQIFHTRRGTDTTFTPALDMALAR